MLKELYLKHFKAFQEQTLTLRNLTLLTGVNSMGKSTILQALLLLRQSYLSSSGQLAFPLLLNGQYIDLGNASDVFYNRLDATDSEFAIGFVDEIGEGSWRYIRPVSADYFDDPSTNATTLMMDNSLFSLKGAFQYLQAERLGPRAYLPTSDFSVSQRDLGKAGEYTIDFLNQREDERILLEKLCFEGTTDNNRLIDQVMLWMSTISPGLKLTMPRSREMGLVRLAVDDHRATNVGFGISYVLPILVAILSAQPGNLILLENPEAHLHPRGQSKIGELMARAAASDIQIICETHSDHILNGIRLAVKNEIVAPDQVALHYFQRPENEEGLGSVEVVTPELDKDGRLDFRPEGFFDEYSDSMRKLM